MLVAQSPISGHQRPRSGRKPLQPTSRTFDTKANLNPAAAVWAENNKENINFSTRPVKKECFQIDASLEEELSAIREKLERLRIDKDKTDKMLRERALLLDSQMKEMVDRGMLQKQLEIEVDRLFRLKEIKLSCTTISPLRSLRDKEEQANKMMHQQLKAKNHSDQPKQETPNHSEIKTQKEN